MGTTVTDIPRPPTASVRVGIYDVVRGLALVSMVLFHLCYDLVYIKGIQLPWFPGTVQTMWSRSIAWTFLFVAGCMCTLSRNNLKRAGVYAIAAVAVFVVTSLAGVDTAISFGIIYSMAACTFVYWCLSKIGLEPHGYLCAGLLIIVFLFVLDIPHGHIGFGAFSIDVPRAPYESGILSWAGFPEPGFSSGDYYPLIPYVFIYLAGAAMGAVWKEGGYPEWASDARVEPFTTLGKYSLVVYALHQPLILAILSFI